MDIFILLTFLQMLSLNEAYNFTCPSQAHWDIRAKSMCEPSRIYTCLFNVTFGVNVYRDICNRPRHLDSGQKYVFQPNLNNATCSVTRYQPFIFATAGYSDCAYQKSFCNSLGQKTYENGNTRSDRKCICNTDRGYTFIMNTNKQCYCNPSTEDCSCYLGINQNNKTIGLKDTKCYDDTKRTGSRYLGDRFNISRKIKIIEFDNYNYNLNYYKYHIEAFQWVLTLSLSSCVVCIILLINRRRLRRFRRFIQIHSKAINHLPEEDKIRFNKLLQTEKTENRYFVRIMIVGKESTGKTCLLRRLLKKSISGVTSTDGVDIVVRKCKINIKDGTWIIGKDIDNDKFGRIKRALSPSVEDRDTQNMQVDDAKNLNISQRDEMPTNKEDIATNAKVSQDKSEDKNESLLLVTPENFTTDAKSILHKNEDTHESSSLVMQDDFTTHTKLLLIGSWKYYIVNKLLP
ncbi:unnamed protein product [Mytilus coruscus]|uniref:Uncharacterized protein n=1 Tax=Mytilus coruscus TaxID=42192 RepID=A0A6J8B045_MYTCO|nr:unnamed protein product [Mytilus coruscus]